MKTELGIISILLILGVGCSKAGRTTPPGYILRDRPNNRPTIVDNSPILCPETICKRINGQRVFLFTERDLLQNKKNHIEKNDYIDYMIDLVSEFQK